MKNAYYLALIVLIGIFAACKKNTNENPPDVLIKTWKIEKVFDSDGIENTDNHTGTLEFKSNGNFVTDTYLHESGGIGTWQYSSNETNIVLTFPEPDFLTLSIIKKDKNSLWVKCGKVQTNSYIGYNNCEIHFMPN